jgi:hypothetical protein
MLPRLSQRTYDLMRLAIDAVDKDTADLITTLVASAFVDGGKEKLARNPDTDAEREDRRWRSRGASRRIPCPRGRAWSADLHGRLL